MGFLIIFEITDLVHILHFSALNRQKLIVNLFLLFGEGLTILPLIMNIFMKKERQLLLSKKSKDPIF